MSYLGAMLRPIQLVLEGSNGDGFVDRLQLEVPLTLKVWADPPDHPEPVSTERYRE
jgi:hypothetical protein